MPSFLSKVFGRGKKHDEKSRDAPSSPLGGKFEAVRLSPGPPSLNENGTKSANGKEKTSPTREVKPTDAPLLSLNLSGIKDASSSRPSSGVFDADPDSRVLLPESVIGARRLSPSETLALVQACGQAITERGLETLGLMHPHWYSASAEVQRKLISHYLQSLSASSPSSTAGTSTISRFQSEVQFTRSPHDIASVFRWGLRHLKYIDKPTFGNDPDWYTQFLDKERSSSHSAKAFSEHLVPLIPASHMELLKYTLELISYIAAHAEANGISGSRLTRFLGLWLLDPSSASAGDDWSSLYEKWDQAGRILEHIFLANIRDEATRHPMPLRLTQVVNHYPYGPTDGLQFLPKPRFSTRQYEALLITLEAPYTADRAKLHPVMLVTEAFKADTAEHTEEGGASPEDPWDKIKNSGSTSEGAASSPPISSVFADETIRLISLIPTEASAGAVIPVTGFSVQRPTIERRRSASLTAPSRPSFSQSEVANGSTAPGHAHQKSISSVAESRPSLSVVTSPLGATDWGQFSKSGFLEDSALGTPLAATLMDHDVETTNPPPQHKKSISRRRGRKSLDSPAVASSQPITPQTDATSATEPVGPSKYKWRIVSVDEAFIDFWSDSLTDPISSHWPNFFVYRLKTPLEQDGQKIEWVVLERTIAKPPPPPPVPETPTADTPTSAGGARPRATSPKPSVSSTTKKRFTFFSATNIRKSNSTHSKKKKDGNRSPKVGEMGEALDDEEAQPRQSVTVSRAPENVPIPESPMPEAQKALPASPEETVEKTGAATPPTVEPIPEEPKEQEASKPSDVAVAGVVVGAAALATGAALATAAVHEESADSKPQEDVAEPTVPALKLDDATLAKTTQESPEEDSPSGPTDSPVELAPSGMVAAAAAEKYHDKAGHESVITPSASIHEDDDPMDDLDEEDEQSEEEKPSGGPSIGASTIIVPPAAATSVDSEKAPVTSNFAVVPAEQVTETHFDDATPSAIAAEPAQEQETVFSAAVPVHHEETAPLDEAPVKVEEEATPVVKESTPVAEDIPSVEEEATPVLEDVPSPEEAATPVPEERAPLVEEGPASAAEVPSAVQEEVQPAPIIEENVSAVADELPPTASEVPFTATADEATAAAVPEEEQSNHAPVAEAISTDQSAQEIAQPIVKEVTVEEPAAAHEAKEPEAVVGEAEPVVQEVAPAVGEAAPIVEEIAPATEEATAVVAEAAPAVEEATPVVEEAAPIVEETAPAVEAAPAAEEATPVVEEVTSGVEEVQPQEAEPIKGEAEPATEEAAASQEHVVLATEAAPAPTVEEPPAAEAEETVASQEAPVESAPEVTEVDPTPEADAPAAPEGFVVNTPRIEPLPITESQDVTPQDSSDLAPVPVVENVPEASPVLMPKADDAQVLEPAETLPSAEPTTESSEHTGVESVHAAGETPGPELALSPPKGSVDLPHAEEPITTDPMDPPTDLPAAHEEAPSSPLVAKEPLVDDEKPTLVVESSPVTSSTAIPSQAPATTEPVQEEIADQAPASENLKHEATPESS